MEPTVFVDSFGVVWVDFTLRETVQKASVINKTACLFLRQRRYWTSLNILTLNYTLEILFSLLRWLMRRRLLGTAQQMINLRYLWVPPLHYCGRERIDRSWPLPGTRKAPVSDFSSRWRQRRSLWRWSAHTEVGSNEEKQMLGIRDNWKASSTEPWLCFHLEHFPFGVFCCLLPKLGFDQASCFANSAHKIVLEMCQVKLMRSPIRRCCHEQN